MNQSSYCQREKLPAHRFHLAWSDVLESPIFHLLSCDEASIRQLVALWVVGVDVEIRPLNPVQRLGGKLVHPFAFVVEESSDIESEVSPLSPKKVRDPGLLPMDSSDDEEEKKLRELKEREKLRVFHIARGEGVSKALAKLNEDTMDQVELDMKARPQG